MTSFPKTSILILLFFYQQTGLFSQDPYFSQFFANRIYLNPAYAGFDPGGAVTLNYREQWLGIPAAEPGRLSGGFRTFSSTVDLQSPCFLLLDHANMGFSLGAFRDEAGSAPLSNQGFSLAVSHERNLIKEGVRGKLQRLDLRIGAQLQYNQQQFDSDYLIYSSQLDPVIGLSADPFAYRLRSALYPNMNIGLLLRGNLQRNRDQSSLFTIGVQMANVNQPEVSLFEPSTLAHIPRRLTVHGGFTARIPRYWGTVSPIYVSPQFRWDSQLGARLNVQTTGFYLFSKGFYNGVFIQYNFPNNPAPPGLPNLGGFLTRNTTTLILNAGIDLRSVLDNGKPWRKRETGTLLGLTYDVNLSGLTQQNTLGVVEISLISRFGKQEKKSCADIGRFELYKGDCPVRF